MDAGPASRRWQGQALDCQRQDLFLVCQACQVGRTPHVRLPGQRAQGRQAPPAARSTTVTAECSMHRTHQGRVCPRFRQRMTVPPRGYPTTWAGGNPQPAPEMGLAPARHGHLDPGPIHCLRATHIHPEIAVFTIQATDGTMGASAQVLDQEDQREHQLLEGHMALAASPASQPCHCPQTLCPPHSHATTSHPSAPSPSPHGHRGALTGTSLLRH